MRGYKYLKQTTERLTNRSNQFDKTIKLHTRREYHEQ